VFGSILHRMILWELIKVFLMSLVGITGILLMAGIVAEASQEGLSPAQILAAIPLIIPSTLPYTIPATTLFACCVVYGRLAADNEILAIKSSGVNIVQVVRPGLLLGLAAAAVTMGLYWDVIPTSHRTLRELAFEDAEELIYAMLRKQKYFNYTHMPYGIWVRDVEGKKLLDPVIKGRNAEGQTTFVAQAKEAELRVDMAHKKLSLRMRFGSLISSDGQTNAAFEYREVEVDLPPNFVGEAGRRPRDMTWDEMLAKRREWSGLDATYKETIAARLRDGDAAAPAPPHSPLTPDGFPDAPPDQPKSLKQLQFEEDYLSQQILWIDVELLMRPALSIGCFCFILVGCPVGIWLSRSDYLSSFIVCFLPIVLIYYPLMLCGTGLAKEGHINPVPLVWGANLLMGLIGGVLFWRLLRN
jgi:lipopolysaccharide export system permease protein